MDKIDKIHIARVTYSIEAKAEVELKNYLKEIRGSLDKDTADEVMEDIESRIPEILAERSIKPEGVITESDVEAIKKQLGEPEQFSDDNWAETTSTNPKKLFRDPGSALIGGVASGIGQYFGIDANIIRGLFFILTFFSGFGIALYVFLWIILPEAKTSVDKLRMSGLPITAASLQTYRSRVQQKLGKGPNILRCQLNKAFKLVLKVILIGLTTFGGLVSLALISVMAIGSSFTFVYPFRPIFDSYGLDYLLLGLLWLISLSLIGLALTLIVRLWGNRSTHLKFSAISFLVSLIVALSASGAIAILVVNHFSNEYGNGKTTVALAVSSDNLTSPTKLVVNSDKNLSLNYVVNSQTVHATYQAYPGLGKPKIEINNSNGVLTINSNDLAKVAPNCLGDLCKSIYLPIRVTVYGPLVNSIVDNNGAELTIDGANFGQMVSVKASNNSSVSLNNSYSTSISLTADSGAVIQASNTSAQQVSIKSDNSSTIFAPATNILTASLPINCDQSGKRQVLILNSYPAQVTVNGQVETPDQLNQNSCVAADYLVPPTPPDVPSR